MCAHAIFYELRPGYPLRCAVCFPPSRPPRRLGLLQPDGAILTAQDLADQRDMRCVQAAASDRIDLIRSVMGGDWELLELETGPDGWPIDSKPMVIYPERGGLLALRKKISR